MTPDIEPDDLHTQTKWIFNESFKRTRDGFIKFADCIPDDAIHYFAGWGVFDTESKNDYDKLEKILTHKITRPFWQKITKLKIEPCEFLNLFLSNNEQNVKKEIQRIKKLNNTAQTVHDAISTIVNAIKSDSSFDFDPHIYESLLKIHQKKQADIDAFNTLSNAIGTPKFKTPEEIFFIKKLDGFFRQYTPQRHELTAICYAIAFDKITEYDKESFAQWIKDTLRENK